ncbi:MAG: fibronectin type III domain-containing protein [Chitinophagales bacterium]
MGFFTKNFLKLTSTLAVCLLLFSVQRTGAQCTTTSQFPSAAYNAPAAGVTYTITTCNFGGEYSVMQAVANATQYKFSSSVTTDFITVRSGSSAGPVVGFGVQPLTITTTSTANLYVHINTNAACGSASTCRTTTVQNLTPAPSGCTGTSQFPSTAFNAPASGTTTTITTCNFAGEYSRMTAVASGASYIFTSSIATDYITIRSGTFNGTVVANGTTPLTYVTTGTADLFIHIHTNSSCGTSSTCRTTAVQRLSPSCTFTSSFGSATAPAAGVTTTISTCSFAGEYSTITGAVAGTPYQFASSVTTDYITIHSGTSNGPVVAAGLTPLNYTATSTATLYAHWATNSACGTASTCRTTTIKNLNAPAFDPCTSVSALNACGTSNTTVIAAGAGAYNPPATSCGFSTPGQEKIYTYTAPTTGAYTITQSASPGYIDYFYKAAASGCNGTGWTCIQDLNGATTSTGVANLTAGTQYYFLLDPEVSTGGTVTFTLNCAPPPFDPCATINNISACGVATSFTVASGNGSYNPPSTSCGFTTPGKETIFTFTPSQTGNYQIAQTSSFGYIDWFYKPVSSGCNGTGWTCIQDLSGAITSGNFALTAGTQYYIMGDPESTTGGAVNFSIGCPPAPLVNDDCSGAITVSCLGSPYTGTTVSATVDAAYTNCGASGTNTTEAGVWYKYVGNNQQVDVTTCDPVGGTGYDTRITVYSGSCGAFTCVTANDDMTPACSNGSFRSEVLFNAFAGTDYYIFVHGYQTGTNISSQGAFTLTLTCSALCSPQISNDDCASADPLTVAANSPAAIFGNNNCASSALTNPSCFSAFATLPDVWYSFVAPVNPAKVVLTYNNGSGTASDLGFVTYGSCGGAQIQCQGSATSGTAYTLTGLTAGQTYYLQVLGPLGNRGQFSIGMYYETCPAPSALASTATTTTTATIDWTENGGATAWDLYYGTSIGTPGPSTTPTEDNVGAHPYTINGLTPGTNYTLYVRADCGGGDASSWVGPITFGTISDPCSAITAFGPCGFGKTISINAGSGLWTNASCDNFTTTPGRENIYSFTPTQTGNYTLSVPTFAFGNEMDFSYKAASLGCDNNNWICQQAIFAAGTSLPFLLNAGTQYYFMFDNEATTASTINVVLDCPVVSTWTGTASTDWFDANNWSPAGVPTGCGSIAVIPTTPVGSQFPIILAANANVGALTVQDNATVTINSGFKLQVCGNLIGGLSTPGQVLSLGELELNGTTNQKLSNRLEVQTLRLNNAAGASLQPGSFYDIFNEVDLQNGTLDATTGTIRFRSTADNQIAVIDDFSAGYTGTISGTIRAERYYHSSSTYDAHYMGSPINNASFSQFGAGGVGGYAVPTATCDETQLIYGSPYGTVARLDETNGASCALGGWFFETGGNADNARGYSVRKSGAGVLTVIGAPNLGSSYSLGGLGNSSWSNVSLQGRPMTSGWQLVANPYLAYLDISSTPGGFDAQKLVWHTSGAFAGTYQPATVVSPFQAFMVHVSAPGAPQTYTINGTSRVKPGTPSTFQKTNDQELTITAANTATQLLDVTTVAFNTDATVNMDAQYDGMKVAGALNRHTLYTHNANPMQWLAVNTLKSIEETSTVPVGFEAGISGNYSFSFGGVNSFDPTSYITLEDKKLNIFHDVRSGDYSFTADATDNFDRFVLHFTPAAKINTTNASCSASGQINIEQPGTASWNYNVTNSNGVVVSSGTLNQANPVTVSAATGVYTVSLTDANNYTVVKNIQVSGAQQMTAGITTSATVAEAGQSIDFTSTAVNATANQWDMGDGTLLNGAMVSHSYTTEGVYTVTVNAVNADGCNATASQQVTVNSKATGINNLTDSKLTIWSNEDRVYVDFSKQKHVEATIDIYNVLGQVVSSEKFGKTTIYSRQLNNLEAGYVVVSVKTDTGITTKKVFITNTK